MLNLNDSPIGVFDSGIGGLTVVKRMMELLPQENIVYFGDIARLPYGTKSNATIRKFAAQTVQFLLTHQVKAIIIACNTISAIAKAEVKQLAKHIPVIDVVSSGSQASAFISTNKKIGVIATPATITSNAYPQAIYRLNPQVKVFSQACAMFVPLIEENFIKHQALKLIAQDYLQPLITQQIDTLVLGCTHYPIIQNAISDIMGNNVKLIDPAIHTVNTLAIALQEKNCLNQQQGKPNYQFFVTEVAPKFKLIGKQCLNIPIEKLEVVNIE